MLQIKSLEAFAKAADGKATKIIIPSEIQGIAGLKKSIAEIAEMCIRDRVVSVLPYGMRSESKSLSLADTRSTPR